MGVQFGSGTVLAGGLLLAVAACAPVEAERERPAPALGAPANARYHGIETRRLDNELVQFLVSMEGANGQDDVIAYARCAAAQYTLIRGLAFTRHLRTNVEERGGVWRADAVYTVSPSLPRGSRTIDAEVTVADCTEQGIPTV